MKQPFIYSAYDHSIQSAFIFFYFLLSFANTVKIRLSACAFEEMALFKKKGTSVL